MANFVVIWWALVSTSIPCPDSVIHKADPYFVNVGSGVAFSCAVLHMKTERQVYTRTFEDKAAADEFVKNAPAGCKGHIQLIDMRDGDER